MDCVKCIQKPKGLDGFLDKLMGETRGIKIKKYGHEVREYDLGFSYSGNFEAIYYLIKSCSCLGGNACFYYNSREFWALGEYMDSFDSFKAYAEGNLDVDNSSFRSRRGGNCMDYVERIPKPKGVSGFLDKLMGETIGRETKKYGSEVGEYDLGVGYSGKFEAIYHLVKSCACRGSNCCFYYNSKEIWSLGEYMDSFEKFMEHFGWGVTKNVAGDANGQGSNYSFKKGDVRGEVDSSSSVKGVGKGR